MFLKDRETIVLKEVLEIEILCHQPLLILTYVRRRRNILDSSRNGIH